MAEPTEEKTLASYAHLLETKEMAMLYQEKTGTEPPSAKRSELLRWMEKQPLSEDLERMVGEVRSSYEALSAGEADDLFDTPLSKLKRSIASKRPADRQVNWTHWTPEMSQGPAGSVDPTEMKNRRAWARELRAEREDVRKRLLGGVSGVALRRFNQDSQEWTTDAEDNEDDEDVFLTERLPATGEEFSLRRIADAMQLSPDLLLKANKSVYPRLQKNSLMQMKYSSFP